MRLARFERDEFVNHRFDWEPGQHLYSCEPTEQGKSFLLNQLIGRILADYEPGDMTHVSLMPKPRDYATSYWARQNGLKVIDQWPPPARMPFTAPPPGYVLWPRHLRKATVKDNRAHLAAVMRPCLKDQYWRGNSITFVDDAHVAAVLLGLNPELEEHLTAGAAMGASAFIANQKPIGSAATGSLTSFAYSAPTHLIFGHDPVEANLRRLAEIGGVNHELIADIVRSLPVHKVMTPRGPKNLSEKLYIHKLGYMCVIGI